MRKWGGGETVWSRKWIIDKEEVAYKKIINCINAVELRNIGKY
jgi:hypothetical protein